MATKYPVLAGGNWSADATWTLNSDGTANATVTPTASDDVIMNSTTPSSGNVLTIDAGAACLTLTQQVGTVGSIQHNGFALTASGSVTLVSGKYSALATSTIIFAASGTLTTGGNLIPLLKDNGGTTTLGDNLTFLASKVIVLTLGGVALNCNGFTITGNSVTNRILITATALGTPRTITNPLATTFNNVDFRDIAFTSASDLDLTNGGANSIGNCGGNSITGGGTTLTFTTAQNPTTITGNSVSLSASAGQWDGGRVPLPQDTTVINMTAGQTLTVDMPRIGKDLSFTTATNFTLGNAVTSYGSVDFTNGGTLAGAFGWTFESALRSGTITVTSAGKSFLGAIAINAVSATTQLGDAFVTTGTFTLNNGTFNDGGFSVQATTFSVTGTSTRAVVRSWTWTATSTGNVWNATTTTLFTLTDTGTFLMTDVSASSKTFISGGLTYNNIQFYGTGSGAIIFTGAVTFSSIQEAPGHLGTKTLTFPASTITTISGDMHLGFGNGTNLLTLNSSTAQTAATINYTAGGTINADYLDVTDINVTPTATWYYGNNSMLPLITHITPTLNGGFETAGGGGADPFANWVENALGTSTVNDETSIIHSGGHACRLDVDGVGSLTEIYQNVITANKKYTVTLWAKISDATGNPTLGTDGLTASGTDITTALTTSYVQYSYTGYTRLSRFNIKRNNGTTINKSFYIDDVVLQQVPGTGWNSGLAPRKGMLLMGVG